MSKLSYLLLSFFTISFFPAIANGLAGDKDSLTTPPRDSSIATIEKYDRLKLIRIQQIIQGNFLPLPANEIAYGDGSGLTSSSNFTWNGTSLTIGNTTSTSTSTPIQISFGGTYSNTPGQNLKLKLYDDGNSGNAFGLGISASQMDYTVAPGSRHVWWTGTNERMRLNSDGKLLINTTDQGDYKLQVGGQILAPVISLGETSSATAGQNLKLKLYEANGTNVFGFGISAYQMDYVVPTNSRHTWWTGTNEIMRLNGDGKLLINATDQGDYKLQVGGAMVVGGNISVLHGSSETPNMLKVGNSGYIEGRPGYSSLLEVSAGGYNNNGSWWTGNSQFASIMSMYNGNIVFTSDQNLPINSNYTPTHRFIINANGTINIPSLSDGTGVPRMVVSTNGVLSYQNISGGGSSSLNQYQLAVGNNSNLLSSSNELTYNAGKLALQYGSNLENNVLQTGGGGYIQGRMGLNSLAEVSGGAFWNGATSWTTNSSSTTASILSLYNGEMWFHTNAGLTPNSPFTPTIRMKLTANGSLIVNSLATGGATKMVVTDANGLLSFQDIPSGSGTSGWTLGGNVASTSDFIGTTNSQSLLFKANNVEGLRIVPSGQVGIATSSATSFSDASYKLFVEGGVRARKVKVDVSGWSDYVFNTNYNLPTLKEVETFINIHQHLPDVPSEREVKKEGIDVAETQALLLKKIEELTLYIIEQEKEIDTLKTQNKTLEQKLEQVEKLKEDIKLIKTMLTK